jgi:hypothetical protein
VTVMKLTGQPNRLERARDPNRDSVPHRRGVFQQKWEMLSEASPLRQTSRVECRVHGPRLGRAHRHTLHDGQIVSISVSARERIQSPKRSAVYCLRD